MGYRSRQRENTGNVKERSHPLYIYCRVVCVLLGTELLHVNNRHMYMKRELKNEIWGKLFQMVPTHLGSLRSRVASAQACRSYHETQRGITILRNTAPYLAGNKIQKHEGVGICIVLSICIVYCSQTQLLSKGGSAMKNHISGQFSAS